MNPMDQRAYDNQPFATHAEMTAAIRDERYRKDEAYEARVKNRIAATDMLDTSNLLINESHSFSDNGLSDYEQINPYHEAPFHTVREVSQIMKSEKYKTDPYYRLCVARDVSLSTPDWQPHVEDNAMRVQFHPEEQ